MQLQPLEEYMLQGAATQFAKRFECMVAYGNSDDKIRTIEKMLQGKGVKYPYAFISLTSIGADNNSYHTQTLARRGIQVSINPDGNQFQRARLIPALFNLEVEYTTNQMYGTNQRSILEFQRRWLFVRRQGGLKFNVPYGDLQIRVGLEMDDSVPSPSMGNKTEQVAEYACTANFTLKGYISEPILGTTGVVQDVRVSEILTGAITTIPFSGV